MEPDRLIREYLLLGLRFDRIEEGYVDSFTGDPRLRRQVADEPAPDPAALAVRAQALLGELAQVPRDSHPATGFTEQRAGFIAAHLQALACAARKFAGEDIGFVDEVRHYFDVEISPGSPDRYRAAHARLDEVLGGTGPLDERIAAHRKSEELPPERLEECVHAFSSALRDIVRVTYPLPDAEHVVYEVVADKPWSGFNYYEGGYRSRVAINADLRRQMGEAAVAAARTIGYEGAGTVEFLVDRHGSFYFMEMNTRIQVEHPVTEVVTGVDLIAEQIRIAGGEAISMQQSDITLRGHAIECRINAEDPSQNFRPAPGKITGWLPPGGPGVRVDSHVYTGYEIPPFYDSLIGKVIVWGVDRDHALRRMRRALSECAITGIPTTIDFHLALLDRPEFQRGDVHTKFVEQDMLPPA